MLDIKSYLTKLEIITKPTAMLESTVLLEQAVPLRLTELANPEVSFSTAKVLFKNAKIQRKAPVKNVWDADIKTSGPGYFDASGNFILDKPKKITTTWLLKRNDSIEGPFTEKEFNELLNNVTPAGYWVKRDSDKGFVQLEKLIQEIPKFTASRDLNRYFSQNQQVEEVKKEDSFFDTPIFAEKSSRLTNFLRNHEISASVDFIVKTIKGMKKVEAIEVLCGITGLDKGVNIALVDLIVESAGYQILSDVDKDGFYLGRETRKEKRK